MSHMPFWDLCELNQLAERLSASAGSMGRGGTVAWSGAGRSWGGGGKKVRPRLLAAAST